MTGGSPEDLELRHLRRDLRGLVGLEWLQMSLSLGALFAIAVRAILIAEERRIAVSIAAVVLLALAHAVLAIRLRAGQNALRRALLVLEIRHESAAARGLPPRVHPYRTRET